MDQDLVDEIDGRLDGEPRAKWIREAIRARIRDEDTGEWERPEMEMPLPDGGQDAP